MPARPRRAPLDRLAQPCSRCDESLLDSQYRRALSTLLQESYQALRRSQDYEHRGHETQPAAPRVPDSKENQRRGWRSLPPGPARRTSERCECESLRACAHSLAVAAESSAAAIQEARGLRV